MSWLLLAVAGKHTFLYLPHSRVIQGAADEAANGPRSTQESPLPLIVGVSSRKRATFQVISPVLTGNRSLDPLLLGAQCAVLALPHRPSSSSSSSVD